MAAAQGAPSRFPYKVCAPSSPLAHKKPVELPRSACYTGYMEVESPHSQESVPRGRLHLLSHPDTDIFSGYGITLHPGRPDHLVGVLMVDRPGPVEPTWLQEIEDRYGEYELIPMTRTGERGLVTQLRIAPDSLSYLTKSSSPLNQAIEAALQPLLTHPPAPTLKLQWDPIARLWRSAFWVGLSPTLQHIFKAQGPGCLALERDGQVTFVAHVNDADLAQFRGAKVLSRWELHTMPTAPLIRFHLAILDHVGQAYHLEHFLNVGEAEQARYLGHLIRQEQLMFDFFGSDFEYGYSTTIAHHTSMRRRLDGIVRRAVDTYGEIPPERRDFNHAKAEFLRRFPLGWSP